MQEVFQRINMNRRFLVTSFLPFSPLPAVVGVAAGVVNDQAEADEEMSLKQRLVLAGGSALAEGGGAVDDLTGVSLAADALEVAGREMISYICIP